MKKLIALLMSILMLTALAPAMAESTNDMMIVYAKVPADWSFPCVWAWASDGTNAFASWPGDMMEPDARNDGWYYIYVPASMESVIINASDASVQTDEVKIDKQNAWIEVAEDKTATVSFEQLIVMNISPIFRATLRRAFSASW